MNNKSIFDKHLYKEGLRGLRGLGCIALGLLCVFSVVFSMVYILNDYFNYYTSAMELFNILTLHYTVIYFIIIILIVPIFTLKTFYFLTTRNGSDFYHSIPHTKKCLLATFGASILTWTSICIVVPCLLSYIINSIASGTLLSIISLLTVLLHIFVAAALVMSVICIACAVTGTILTNIITTAIILFIPRLLLYAFRLLLSVYTSSAIARNSFLFGTKCNLIVQSILDLGNPYYYLYNYKPLIYSLILSILYFIIAVVLFERRPSEIAMKPTLGKRLQAFLCIVLGTAFSVFPIALMVSYRLRAFIGTSSPIMFYVITMYLLIVIGMGMYELLTTRRIRNLVHIIPRTLILFVINLLIIGGLSLGKHAVYSYSPGKEEIKSVSFEFDPYVDDSLFLYRINSTLLYAYSAGVTDYYDVTDSNDYLLNKFNEYSTNDDEVKEIIANALNRVGHYYNNYDEDVSLHVYVNTGIRTATRNIRLSYDDYNKLRRIVLNDTNFTRIYSELPSVRKENLSISSNYNYISLPSSDLAELYTAVQEEIAAIDTDLLQTSVFSYNSGNWPTLSFAVNSMYGYIGSQLTISPNVLPASYQKYLNLINKNNTKTMQEHINETQIEDSGYLQMHVLDASTNKVTSNVTYSMSDTRSFSLPLDHNDQEKALLDLLISLDGGAVDLAKKDMYTVEVILNTYSDNDELRTRSIRYIQVEKETLDSLTKEIQDFY
ncbi:MAG: hypothetical protein Q4F05_00540 [bacterium]|nr:hypothetical protein [bacterium]